MSTHAIDLLLLNASNYPGQPIYPYAFVQVSALAREHGLKVERYDFLGAARSEWFDILRHLLNDYRPRMIGFHVRQADSQTLAEYQTTVGSTKDAYFPLNDTMQLIKMTRQISGAPVVIGGFAVSVHGMRICDLLLPEYAICGAPDSFFRNFDALAARDTSLAGSISNLIWKQGNTYNSAPQEHFLPFAGGEYDDEIFRDLCAFYSKHGRQLSLGRQGAVDVPVEIMRGCPCQCYFCTEPKVKGRRAQKRDIDAIMKDVMFLADRDIRSVWFICSEINMYGMAFPLELAGRMEQLNADLGTRRVLWKAYAMPRPGMSFNELRYMMSTGYVPGWNEFASFDDENLRACGMPYNAGDVIRYFKDILELSNDRSIYHGPPLRKFEMFLGNAYMTARALRTTLAVVDREGFGERHHFGGAMSATRVYEAGEKLNCGTLQDAFSIGPEAILPSVNTLYPTFYHAPELLQIMGTSERLGEFFTYVADTILSCNYRQSIDLLGFLASAVSAEIFAKYLCTFGVKGLIASLCIFDLRRNGIGEDGALLGGHLAEIDETAVEALWRNPNETRVRLLYDPASAPYSVRSCTLEVVLDVLFKLNARNFERVLKHLGLEDHADRKTPYRIMRRLYERFESKEALLRSVSVSLELEWNTLEILQLRHLLYVNNVRIEQSYGQLLFDSIAPSSKRDFN